MRGFYVIVGVLWMLVGCAADQPRIVITTPTANNARDGAVVPATAPAISQSAQPTVALSPVPEQPLSNPTPNPTRLPDERPSQHTVGTGQTLFLIAQQYGTDVDTLIELNQLENPDWLSVGQVLTLPDAPSEFTPMFKIIPDSRLVCALGCHTFDLTRFIAQQPGYIREVTDEVSTRLANGAEYKEVLSSAQIIERIAWEYSVDPRLLLLLLEYRAGWLSNPTPPENLQTHPLIGEQASGGIDRKGLYRQLAWAANELNRGYYGWKYRGESILRLADDTRRVYAPGLNAGTVALQYFLSLGELSYATWLNATSPQGIYQLYVRYFGDPFMNSNDPLIAANLEQPTLQLPFQSGSEWRYTGGPHGGWGNGSAWASLDFAPPDERPSEGILCYTSTTPVTAVSSGIVTRSENGAVILDIDGDADETTGWVVMYLHIASDGRVAANTPVQAGDVVGYASCEGGFSTATHIHIGRRYNGEWIPADCMNCPVTASIPDFIMSNWRAEGLLNQLYQGYMVKGDTRIQAEQGRSTTINLITW